MIPQSMMQPVPGFTAPHVGKLSEQRLASHPTQYRSFQEKGYRKIFQQVVTLSGLNKWWFNTGHFTFLVTSQRPLYLSFALADGCH